MCSCDQKGGCVVSDSLKRQESKPARTLGMSGDEPDRTECRSEMAVRLLHNEIETAHGRLSEIAGLLARQLTSERPVCDGMTSCISECSGDSQLMNQIDAERRLIVTLINRFDDLIDRLEV